MSDAYSFDSDASGPADAQRRLLLLQQLRQAANATPSPTASAPPSQSVANVDPSTVPGVQSAAPDGMLDALRVANATPSTVPPGQVAPQVAPSQTAAMEPSPIWDALNAAKHWYVATNNRVLQKLGLPQIDPETMQSAPAPPPKPLTPEEQAMPYRTPPRLYDLGPMMDTVTDAIQGKGTANTDDMIKLATYGTSLVTQPLRGIGDIVNLIRGTKYPRYQQPATVVLPPNET